MKKKLLSLFAGIACAISAYAVPAMPGLTTVSQPDGSSVTLQLVGDEFLHFTTTADGYTVERNDAGYYVYMQKVNGELVMTDIVAHDAASRSADEVKFLNTLPKNLSSDEALSKAQATRAEFKANTRSKGLLTKPKGAQYDYNNFRGLVILVEFSDRQFSRTDALEVFTDLVTKKDYKGVPSVDDPNVVDSYTGSVRDYFYDNSLGKFDPEFDVVGPIKINYSCKSVNGTNSAVITAAINAANEVVDFSQYDRDGDGEVDMFYLIFAGYGANFWGNDQGYLWPHQGYNFKYVDGVWTARYACSTEIYGNEPSTLIDGIGTICHEFSHVLGLVDEYDTDYEGSGGQSFTPGQWSIMAGGSYNNYARNPVAYSALQRTQAGFITPVEITEEGEYTLNPITETEEAFILQSPTNYEYFLFENRSTASKWDKYIPGDGMLVYHVDETDTKPWINNTINCNPAHNYYELLRADPSSSKIDSSGDPFPGTGNVTVLSSSSSPANLVAWNGGKAPFAFSNISLDNEGVIHFTVSKDYFGSVTEDFENIVANETQTDMAGVYTSWSCNNASLGIYGASKGNGNQSIKIEKGGEVTMANVYSKRIDEIEFAVWNPSLSASAKLTVSVSTDDGATWTEIFVYDSTTPVSVSKGKKNVRYKFVANVAEKAMFKIASNNICYIDDVTLYYNDPNGLSAVESVKTNAKETFRVAVTGNSINVFSEGNEAIEVYNAAGLLVTRAKATGNATTITLPGRGFYIIRQGASSTKITL